MEATSLILAMLATLPSHEIKGKKRLQKLAYLLKEAGLECDVDFSLRDYGPFSLQLAQAADFLNMFDYIEQNEISVGEPKRFMTVYHLKEPLENYSKIDNYFTILDNLNNFNTIELEIAATIRYFESQGLSFEISVEKTRAIKPNKTNEKTIMKSKDIIRILKSNLERHV